MTDIAKIAAACANRIMDRMEMCRGSAILKSDIEREVEMALREEFNPLWPTVTDEGKQALADGLGSIMRRSPQATYDASADTEEDDEYSAHVKSHDDAFLDDFFGVSAPPVNNVEKCYVYHKDSALHVYDEDGGKAQERIDKMFRAYERTMGQLTEQSVNPPKVETVLLPAESTPDGGIAVRRVLRPGDEDRWPITLINECGTHYFDSEDALKEYLAKKSDAPA